MISNFRMAIVSGNPSLLYPEVQNAQGFPVLPGLNGQGVADPDQAYNPGMRMPAQDDLDPLDFLREHSIRPVPDMEKDDNDIRFIFEFLNLFLDGLGGRQKSNTRYVAGGG